MALTVLINWLFSSHFQNYPARLYENKTITKAQLELEQELLLLHLQSVRLLVFS